VQALLVLLLVEIRAADTSSASAACWAILLLRLRFPVAAAELLLIVVLLVSALLPLAGSHAALLFACTLLRVRLVVPLPVAVFWPVLYVSTRRTCCLVLLRRLLPAEWCSALSCGAAVDADRLAARGIKQACRVLFDFTEDIGYWLMLAMRFEPRMHEQSNVDVSIICVCAWDASTVIDNEYQPVLV
jgi:hypothetical protein